MGEKAQGQRFASRAQGFVALDNLTDQVMFSGRFLTSFSAALNATANDTRSGKGNALVMRTFTDGTFTGTMEIADWNMDYVAASAGSRIEYALREFFVIEKEYRVGAGGAIALERAPAGAVSVKLPGGGRTSVTPGAGDGITLGGIAAEGDCVFVTYPFMAEQKAVAISSELEPLMARLIIQAGIYEGRYGQVGTMEVDLPAFAFDPNLNINVGAAGGAGGATSSMTVSGVALSVEGEQCGEGGVFGYVKELVEMDSAPQVVEIVASPSPLTLAVGGTAQLRVVGLRGGMNSNVIFAASDCAFVSEAAAVATVNAVGLVTGVSAGQAVITVTHTATGLTDTVDVEVA